jgi:hypothetical protein
MNRGILQTAITSPHLRLELDYRLAGSRENTRQPVDLEEIALADSANDLSHDEFAICLGLSL